MGILLLALSLNENIRRYNIIDKCTAATRDPLPSGVVLPNDLMPQLSYVLVKNVRPYTLLEADKCVELTIAIK